MPELRLRDVPTQGRASTVYLSLLPTGDRTFPIFQTLANTGFAGLVTVVAATSGESYIAVVAGTAYTVVASSTDTKKSIAQALIALIEAGATGAKAYNLRQNGANWEFYLHRSTTFTLANTGTTTPASMTVGSVSGAATTVSKGATSITLAFPLIGRIAAGQYLRFASGNTEVTVKVMVTAEAGATSLTVQAVDEAIPAAAIAAFPPEFTHRSAASISPAYEFTGFSTFNTGGFEDAVQTTSSAEADLSGIYFELDPVYRTIADAAPNGREFALILDYKQPKEGWSGRRRMAVCGITGREEPVTVEGFIEANFTAKVLTVPTEIPAAPL